MSAYVANLVLYRSLVHWLTAVPPELVSFIGTFVIFVTYSYPMRRLVIFRLLRKEALAAAPVAPDPAPSDCEEAPPARSGP